MRTALFAFAATLAIAGLAFVSAAFGLTGGMRVLPGEAGICIGECPLDGGG